MADAGSFPVARGYPKKGGSFGSGRPPPSSLKHALRVRIQGTSAFLGSSQRLRLPGCHTPRCLNCSSGFTERPSSWPGLLGSAPLLPRDLRRWPASELIQWTWDQAPELNPRMPVFLEPHENCFLAHECSLCRPQKDPGPRTEMLWLWPFKIKNKFFAMLEIEFLTNRIAWKG